MCHGFCLLTFAHRFPPYVRNVETSLDTLQTAVIDGSTPEVMCTSHEDYFVLTYRTQWFTVITIQTSMLVEGVVEMVKAATLDTEVLNHLKSRPVWTAAKEYVSFSKLLDPFRT